MWLLHLCYKLHVALAEVDISTEEELGWDSVLFGHMGQESVQDSCVKLWLRLKWHCSYGDVGQGHSCVWRPKIQHQQRRWCCSVLPIFQPYFWNRITIGIYKKLLNNIEEASLTRLGRRAAVAVGKFNMSHSTTSLSDGSCLLGNIKEKCWINLSLRKWVFICLLLKRPAEISV